MKFTQLKMVNRKDEHLALSCNFPNVIALKDIIEDCPSPEVLPTYLSTISSCVKSFDLSRVTEEYIRLRLISTMCDNEYFLYIYK